MNEHLTTSNPQSVAPAGNPFRHRAFTVIWIATVVSNIGGWMYSVASGWLMTSLDSNALIVSMVQVANSLPMFLFAIPAGALADIVNQRRFLIVGESTITIVSAALAALVWLHLITPVSLLLFSFVVTVGSAMTAPAWQSVVAKLVPKADLPSAVAANSVGINVSRAIGPALGGIIIAAVGIAAPFWLDAFSNIGVIAALIWWRAPTRSASALPPEPFGSAIRTGLRYARYNSYLRATLIRTVAFFVFGSAYWALLPLVARTQIAGGPALYGVLLGVIGASAVGGAFLLRRLWKKFGADFLVAAASLGTALATALFALARYPAPAMVASLIAGACWIAAVSSLNVSAQVALPEWVRGRGLAMYMTVLFGALTIGSAIWGQLAVVAGLPAALLLAAAGAAIAIPLTWRWKLQTGAYDWGIFEDPADDGRFIETFLTDSWLEHLRLHRRVTKADRISDQAVRRFQIGDGPKITHLISAQRI